MIGGLMAKRINIDLDKVGKTAMHRLSQLGKEIVAHKDEILAVISVSAIIDSIKTHIEKNAIERAYEEDSIKYKSVARKHEAEIQVLKQKANKSEKAEQRVQQLEQVVQDILEERSGNE